MLKITTDRMRYVFATIFLLSFSPGRSQLLGSSDSASIYISRLNWGSFSIAGTYAPKLGLSNDAKRLVAIKDGKKVRQLLDSIVVSQKTVVIHLILSQLFQPNKQNISESYIYSKDSNTVASTVFCFNGLKWVLDDRMEYSITQDEIKKVERYWRRLLRK